MLVRSQGCRALTVPPETNKRTKHSEQKMRIRTGSTGTRNGDFIRVVTGLDHEVFTRLDKLLPPTEGFELRLRSMKDGIIKKIY